MVVVYHDDADGDGAVVEAGGGRQQLLDFEPATRRFAVFTVRKMVGSP